MVYLTDLDLTSRRDGTAAIKSDHRTCHYNNGRFVSTTEAGADVIHALLHQTIGLPPSTFEVDFHGQSS